MANVWKIGSRWSYDGRPESSILSIFRRNNIVFAGDRTINRFRDEVKKGDYFAIADGYQVVAIAKALDVPKKIENLNIDISEKEESVFNLKACKDWLYAVRVNIINIKENSRITYKKRGSFFKANQIKNKVIGRYNNHHKEFAIKSYTSTLFKVNNEYKSVFDTSTKYIIPIYQRPYSWSEKEIIPFINDLFNNYLGIDISEKSSEPMFIGTMQLSEKKYVDKNEYEQEVIDGQQRLTTLSILLKVLSIKYQKEKVLKDLKFDWLESRINKQQNNYLVNFFKTDSLDSTQVNNKYFINAQIIEETLNELIEEREEANEEVIFNFSIEDFCQYLFTKVYFVIIETYAGLSKTLQIFNTINTTGLDLNGGDLFKIRMYEYLTTIKNRENKVFDEISELYEIIDQKNKGNTINKTDINWILAVYKQILISKYNLPNVLYDFGWETFYERLFDTLLGIKEWEHFSKVLDDKFEINLEEIKSLIDVMYDWKPDEIQNPRTWFSYKHIFWSRYSKYWIIVYLISYKYKDDSELNSKVGEMLISLHKLFFIYSIRYARAVNEIHRFMHNVYKTIITKDYDLALSLISKKLESLEKSKIEADIGGYIADNARKKNLICSLSAFLDELDEATSIADIEKKVFKEKFDVEHIHATADASIKVEDSLQNSIGNLVLLERNINRSILNKTFSEKKKAYKNSGFASVRKLIKKDKWEQEEIEERKKQEIEKIIKYLGV